MDHPVSTDDLSVVLGSSTILRGIDMTVTDGETVALLGANGSGKSTLVKALVGVVPITRGRARLYGRDVTTESRQVAWGRVGYVPQRVTAGGGVPATALEVVTSGLLDGRRVRPGAAGRRRALEALDQVGLADRARDSVQVFSGGQQQRVLIARALVRDPDLLVLDEPLAGIDRDSKEQLAGTLATLHEDGRTILVVLHELGELGPLVERCVVLRHGRVVHDGAPPRPAPGHDDPEHEHVHAHGGDQVPDHHVPDLNVEL
ncbi:metal ABC transporter ATP-binding protein [Georgenia subflava]|uniref:ATP-binding cassette domain-containing protein n=1 Tax=Georgenia subflava TaxID=1622177 RepID=A0A6N7ERZ3_9MICO|nr:ATP-binding cassette domain-containing protein [Georgenia subflava]MPV37954.1 ATP-binding cassette domain-containing protein [Georgenia subflava]